jgi:hypothetical protein
MVFYASALATHMSQRRHRPLCSAGSSPHSQQIVTCLAACFRSRLICARRRWIALTVVPYSRAVT